jgi:hypothetical protein
MTSDASRAAAVPPLRGARSTAAAGHRFNPRPRVPKPGAGAMYTLHRLLEPNPLWRTLARVLERRPALYRAFTWGEEKTKSWMFGCRMCGQCALPTTAYACPQTCPKQLRNGPCGGVSPDGYCEVYPEMRCVWAVAYERADAAGRIEDLRRLVRPIDQTRWGESSWVNFWLDRDEGLWTEDNGLRGSTRPAL